MIFAISVFSIKMTVLGVFFGTKTPNQTSTSYPGTPASAIVGSWGRAEARDELVTPSALSLPARMCGTVVSMLPNITCAS